MIRNNIYKLSITLLLMLLGGISAWAQTDHSGVYYIKHNADNSFYLCTSTVFYDGNHYANSGEMPYLTTAKDATIADDWDKDAVWRIIKAEFGNYYYVVHAVDGKYLTLNDDPTNFINNKNEGNRLSLHLQYLKDEEKSLFIITKSGSWYNITPKTKSTWSLNPAGNNYDTRDGHSDKKQNIAGAGNNLNVGGLIGLWLNANDNSKWQFEAITDKPICEAPSFTNNGTVSISCGTAGAHIYYTTDGSTIPTTSTEYANPLTVTEDIDVIWARATTQDSEPYYWSPLSVYVIPQCATPVISIINGKLNLSCATEGATIYYTINGADPTTEYDPNNKPDATESDIIKAIATKNGYHKSKVASVIPSLTVHNTSEIDNMLASYILASDFVVSSSVGTEAEPFRGVIDGGLNTFSGVSHPLVAYANGATIKNVILDNVNIGENDNGNAGAICCEASGETRIYNCGVKSGTISGTNAGSIVGKLDGYSHVINCYSFATVSGGTWGAGIVGYNGFSSTRSDLRTMVMNCMFYGEISSNTNLSPIYGGEKITNVGNLNGYNYYRFDANYSKKNEITAYNCALAAEEKYLTRFEFFRNTLNSNRELAAWYATGDPNDGKGIGNACKMAKWVLDPADKPYPILKAQDYYPSFINYEDAPDLGTISLTISESNTTTGGKDKPSGASINSNYPTTLTVYDKDLDHKHFNYRTVRLPYYNEVGTGNCTHNRVVTGWKITGFSGGTQGHFVKNVLDYSGTTHAEDVYPPYNFADRYCTDKDKYSVSGRVFSQGAYYDVPEGVTGITIEPYWGAAVYLSDPTYDVAYPYGYGDKNANAVFVSNMGSRYVGGNTASINDDNQTVYTDYDSAFGQVGSGNVYDNAIVLVGNYHHYWGKYSPSTTKAFTIMSADLNNDCEPDYSFIVQHGTDRQFISPIRFDFINSPGLGMIQKVETDKAIPKHGIWWPKGWFEVTNTTLIEFTQFEYDNQDKPSGSPLILLGGIYDQFVTSRRKAANSTEYIHLGSNIWMKEFCNGTHTDNANTTRHVPISVTGGEFESFYLTGTFRPSVESITDNAECYINGGKFGDMAGSGQEQLKGDVTWLIDHADITNFYGGGINDQKPVLGHIYVEINNSNVGLYCGGPKFGNMQDDMKVTTKAKGSTFGNFYGAGYGGTSYYRDMTRDETGGNDWDTWNADYTRKYVSGKGISTGYECEFIPYSGGQSGQSDYVGRFYVLYASLSLAKTKNVESTLEDCHITGSFYGGGKLGSVDGNITSTLKNCIVDTNVFGAGFSASVEKVNVVPKGTMMKTNPAYNESVGVFTDGTYPDGVEYTWTHAESVSAGNEFDNTNHLIYTTTDLTALGAVTGNATLNIEGTTTVGGSVYGGGEESVVNGDTHVTINGGSMNQSVYGGGCEADVMGNTNVSMTDGYVFNGIFGGGLSGSVGTFNRSTGEDANVYGHTAHEGCIGKPVSCAEGTGKCTVVVSGGQIGPIEVATLGMNRSKADGGPVPEGWVWGAGQGLIEDPATHPDTHFNSYVGSTDVTIKENAFILESIIGGGEFGRVLGNTLVKIEGGQIGVGEGMVDGDGKPIRYAEEKFVNPLTTPITSANALAECSHYPYGKDIDSDGKLEYLPYDPYYDDNKTYADAHNLGPASTSDPCDGKTWIGCVFGGGSGYMPFKNATGYDWVRSAGWVEGNSEVRISGGHILTNVYGGNEVTDVKGKSIVKMTGGTIGVPRTLEQIAAHPVSCYLFGAGKGDDRPHFYDYTNTDSVEVEVSGGIIYGSVFGGSEDGHVTGDIKVDIKPGAIIGTWGTSYVDGNVFGAGRGYSGNTLTAGNVGGNVTLNISGGDILGSVYGGGRLASVGTYLVPSTDANYGELIPDDEDETHGHITVNISGGTIGNSKEYIYNPTAEQQAAIKNTTFDYQNHLQYTKGGNVFTAGMGRLYALDNTTVLSSWQKLGQCKQTELNMTGGTVKSSIYGGGEIGIVAQNATLNINGGTVGTKVADLEDATKYYYFGSVFGGGKGSTANIDGISAAGTTQGDVEVNLNKTVASNDEATGAIVHQVFGCNDMNGSPKGTVTVYVYATQNADKANISTKYDKDTKKFDVEAVYGGGNLAAYEPEGSKNTTKSTSVIIDGCGLTSIRQVYGGGNAASTPATNVVVNGTYEILELFGGGNGFDKLPDGRPNPGANVGYKNYTIYEKVNDEWVAKDDPAYDTKEERTAGNSAITYGTGQASINVFGGTVHRVFGGSNTKGNVRQTAVTLLDENSGCAFCVDEAYGGGKSAPMDAEAKLLMACIPGLEAAYGGAEAAAIQGNVTLNITNGTFDRVFGGNNLSGTINGSITVNVEEVGCKPIKIGELYGGGNQAGYSVYGYNADGTPKESGTKLYEDPQVNVKSFTSIGKVFGGGYGDGATMVGNPTVNINEVYGKWYNNDESVVSEGAKTNPNGYSIPSHAKGKMGAISEIFGGGNAAKVIGNTTVNIATQEEVYIVKQVTAGETLPEGCYTRNNNGTYSAATGTAAENTTYYEKKDVLGVDIRGNVYGGGNNAEVTGNTNVNIGKKK